MYLGCCLDKIGTNSYHSGHTVRLLYFIKTKAAHSEAGVAHRLSKRGITQRMHLTVALVAFLAIWGSLIAGKTRRDVRRHLAPARKAEPGEEGTYALQRAIGRATGRATGVRLGSKIWCRREGSHAVEAGKVMSVIASFLGDRRMWEVNLLIFFFYMTLGTALPYIPLYYRRMGIPDSQIGLLGAITPTVTLVVSPLWGAFADSKQMHKQIMLLTFISSVILRYGLFFAKDMNILMLAGIVCLTAVLNAPVKPLIDSAVMNLLPAKEKGSYGKTRFFGQVGFGLGSYLVSSLVGASNSRIRHIFNAHVLCAIPTAMLMSSFEPVSAERYRGKATSGGNMKEALDVVWRDPAVRLFFFVVFLVGLSSGIIENFAYVRISEVGNPKNTGNTMGMLRLISSVAGGPMFWLSGFISKKIGSSGILATSLLSYTLRFFIYAMIENSWQALPAELLRGLVFAIFWAGCTLHVYEVAPQGLVTTMLAVLNAVYHGLGQSTGALMGGQLIRSMGSIREAFLKCGMAEAVVLVVFAFHTTGQASAKPPSAETRGEKKNRSPSR